MTTTCGSHLGATLTPSLHAPACFCRAVIKGDQTLTSYRNNGSATELVAVPVQAKQPATVTAQP